MASDYQMTGEHKAWAIVAICGMVVLVTLIVGIASYQIIKVRQEPTHTIKLKVELEQP